MIPETLLHYRILQPLGSGGMGDVYLAEDTKLGRRVALKVLPRSRASDPEHRQRFEREARAIAALNHPNIVTIHSVEQADDVTFLTMELVEGKTLSQLIQKGGLPIDRLLKLAIPLADAVATAHDRGITHRDLKPGNVMVASDGRLKVLDFGLAKLQEVADTPEAQMTALKPDVLTGEGKIVGTVAYMSPEQAEGKPIDHRSDIFSLGVVLYELATGDRPFKGDTSVSVMSSILRDTPSSITDINRSLPRDLARARKFPLAFTINTVVWSPDGSTLVSMQQADLQGRQKIVAVSVSTGAETAVGQLWNSVESLAWTRDGRGLIAAAAEDAPGAPTQIWYVTYPQGEARRVSNDLNTYGQVTVSADGRTISAVQGEALSHIWVAPIGDTARARQITTGTGRTDGGGGIDWTPDGRVVYTSNASGNADIWIADPSGEHHTQLTVDPAVDVSPEVTPDGRTIVFQSTRAGGSIWQMDIDGGNQRPVVTAGDAFSPVVSPDSKWLYYTVFAVPRQVWRMPLAGGAPERLTAKWESLGIKDEGVFYHPTAALFDLSPDGTQSLAFYSDPERRGWRIGVFPIGGGEPKRLEILTPMARWSPDGKSVLYVDPTGGAANVAQQPLSSGPPTRLTSFTSDGVFNFAISRNGKQLAMSRGSVTSDVVLMRTEQ